MPDRSPPPDSRKPISGVKKKASRPRIDGPPAQSAALTMAAPVFEPVQDSTNPAIPGVLKPTMQDLNAVIQRLRHKQALIAKNQKVLAQKIDFATERARALNTNLINAAIWFSFWAVGMSYSEDQADLHAEYWQEFGVPPPPKTPNWA